MVIRKKRTTPSLKINHTHQRVVPFLDERGSRFIYFCGCGFHGGIVHPSSIVKKSHCNLEDCSNMTRVDIPYLGKEYDDDLIFSALTEQQESQRTTPVYPIRLRKDEIGQFFWVKDRGNFLYFLKNGKEKLLESIEDDHEKLYVSR